LDFEKLCVFASLLDFLLVRRSFLGVTLSKNLKNSDITIFCLVPYYEIFKLIKAFFIRRVNYTLEKRETLYKEGKVEWLTTVFNLLLNTFFAISSRALLQ